MAYQMQTQTNETIAQNNATWHAIHGNKSIEETDRAIAEYKRETRVKAAKRYLKERARR